MKSRILPGVVRHARAASHARAQHLFAGVAGAQDIAIWNGSGSAALGGGLGTAGSSEEVDALAAVAAGMCLTRQMRSIWG